MRIEDKRSQYNCKSKYVPLKKIPTWKEHLAKHAHAESAAYSKIETFNEKISIFVGDITQLEIDAIVNADTKTLLGGGGGDVKYYNLV
ncbi:hypothetical protein JTE90_021974 [Oedothorax gibbosus]|uniref:Macro domain-containing protein n=1 Tax=Oedothorax gibbosus TaxID=931172 RepID=A0AAV6U029_9ARAC|nr:hypothetical protein JTE90_021974 [Oedothorax gibbosus]